MNKEPKAKTAEEIAESINPYNAVDYQGDEPQAFIDGFKQGYSFDRAFSKDNYIDDLTEQYIQSMADVSLYSERDFKVGYHTGYKVSQSRITELEAENKKFMEAFQNIMRCSVTAQKFGDYIEEVREIAEQALKQNEG